MAGPARTRTLTTPPITRVANGTGPRNTALARDGDRATRDSDGHAHPPRDHVALASPHPRPLPPATRRPAAAGPPAGDGSGTEGGAGADAVMRTGDAWGPGTRHDSDSAQARNPLLPLTPR